MTPSRGGGPSRGGPSRGGSGERGRQELAQVEQTLRAQGFRWTNQRRLIARVALASHQHYSADELLALCQAEDRSVSRATVYRTLAVLREAGFVESLDVGSGGQRFEHVLGHAHHDHMVCTACGKIIEFVDAALEQRQEEAARRHGFRITSHSLKLFGVCRDYEKTGKPCRDGDLVLDK